MPDFTGGQFPSLDGDPAAEVAQRTEPATDGDWFRRVFTVHDRAHTRDLPLDHQMHLDNFGAVLQAALQQGLHPKDVPELESEADHPTDPHHTDLTYRVRVVPAVADEHPETTVTPSVLPQLLAAQPVELPEEDEEVEPEGGGVAPPPEQEAPVPDPEIEQPQETAEVEEQTPAEPAEAVA